MAETEKSNENFDKIQVFETRLATPKNTVSGPSKKLGTKICPKLINRSTDRQTEAKT